MEGAVLSPPGNPPESPRAQLPGREGVLLEPLGQLALPGLRLPPLGLGPMQPRRSGPQPESQPVSRGLQGGRCPSLRNLLSHLLGGRPGGGSPTRAPGGGPGCSPARGTWWLLRADPAGG